MSIFSSTIVNMSIETPDGVLDVTNATLRVPQIEVQGTSVTTSLSTLSNVGVGTASPDGRLHVYGPDAKTLLQSTSNTANVEIGGPSGAIVDLKGPFTDDYDLRIQSSSDGGNLATTGNVNHIRLASASGYTGFGTSAPQYKIDVQGVKGVDAVSNPSAYNAVFLYDDQESTTTFSGTVGGTGASRDTSSKYLELNSLADNVTGYVYWPIQMPNSWSAEFDYYVAGGDGGESVSFSFFNTSAPTTTGNHGGYRLAIAENYGGSPAAKVVLYYQGSEVAQSDIAGGIPTSSWNKVVVNYNRGSISLSFNGRSVFSYEATENADSYTGRYTGFIGKTNLRNNYHRVRNVKCTSGTNWVYATGSNATTLAYLSGNVGIGTDVTTERLEISGNVKATHFVGDGGLLSNIATTLNAIVNQGNTTSNTVQFTNADTGIVATGNIVVEEGGFFVGDGSKLVNIPTDFESIIVNGNTTSNVVFFANTNVAIQASGNIVVDSDSFFIGNGGLLSNIATTLEDISNQGNTTSNTIQFTNSDVGFVTTANVGISNSAPTNHLSVGSNLHVNDTGSNVLTVHGNVAANTLTLGDFQVVASYGLNHVTAENNQTGDTLVLTNATKGIDASSNIDLGGQLNFDSNVKIVGGGTGTYVNNLRIAPVASNIVTYDQATGEVFDSGGLISNKLAIVSEQPPSALTGATTLVDGHGRYKVTTSLEAGSYQAWKCFNKSIDNADSGWSTGANGAYNGDGTYAGSNVIAGVSGEWVKIEFPYKTTLRHVSLSPNVYYSAMPENFSIVASNDDSNWTVIKSVTGQAWTSADYVNFVVNAGVAYKYYAIVAQLTNTNYAYIGEWRLFTETFTVDAGVVSTTAASGLDVGYTEHPVVPLTGSTTYNANIGTTGEFPPSTHYVEGHGTYEAWASTQYNVSGQATREVWKLFDGSTSTYFQQGAATNYDWYNTSSPYEYVGTRGTTTTDVGGTRYMGVWVQLKLPYTITLAYTKINNWTDNTDRSPGAGVILGSNDGDNWYKLTEFSGLTYTSNEEIVQVNATTPYRYYRMVATNTVGSLTLNFTEWRLFAEKPVTRMENVHISGDLSSETLQTGYIKWPKVPLKANDSEGYVVTASSVENTQSQRFAFNAFNEFTRYSGDSYAPNWISRTGAFDSSGEAVNGTAASFDGNDCEWIQIKLPQSIRLSSFKIRERDISQDGPKSGFMYGSNDGVTWSKLATFNDISYDTNSAYIQFVNSSQSYSYFRVVVTKVTVTGTPRALIEEIALYEAATGVGAAPTSAKLQVAGSLGMAKGAEFFAGDDVVMELPKHDRPLTKYPEVAMTADSSGGYSVQYSSRESSTHAAYKAFNDLNATNYTTSFTTDFNTFANGLAAVSRTTGSDTFNHEYIQLNLPKPIHLKEIDIYKRGPDADNTRQPKTGRVYGSNDGTTFDLLLTYSGLTYNGHTTPTKVRNPNTTKRFYNRYRFVITEIHDTTDRVSIGEMDFWGHEEGDTSVDVVHRSIPNTPSPQHLEVYWDAADSNSYSFADSSNVYDLSGSGVTGVLTGSGNTFDTTYNAWKFTTSSSLKSPALSISGDYVHSMSVWFRLTSEPSTWSGGRAIMSLHADAGISVSSEVSALVVQTNGTVRDNFWNNDIDYNSPFKINTWHHVVFTYSGTSGTIDTRKIYVDTKLLTGAVTSGGDYGDPLSLPSNSKFAVGEMPGVGLQGAGDFANARLFSKVLNADQVRELYEYDAPRFGHRQNLVALHKGNLGVGVAHPTSRFEIAGADGVQEFPPKAMTGYETYIEGHGVFRASGSSEYNTNYTWRAFDENTDTFWHAPNSDMYPSGIYSGTQSIIDYNGSVYNGEWISIELPYHIYVSSFSHAPRKSNPGRAMEAGTLLGWSQSLGGWEVIKQWSGLTWTSEQASAGILKTVNVSATKVYNNFVFVITKTEYSPNIAELRLFGTPAPSSLEDGHLTLGKAITLPRVSGHAAGAETPRAESLVVHYDTTVDSVIGGGGSTVVDTSDGRNNGSLINGTAYSSTDRALTFDGGNDYVSGSIPSSMSGNHPYSFSIWIKPDAIQSGYVAVFEMGQRTNNRTAALYLDNGVILHIAFGNNLVSTTSVVANQWIHITGTYTSGSRKVYANGQLLTSDTYSSLDIGATTLTLGANNDANQEFDGSISNFKIWDVALTAEEVAAEYALGRTGKSLNLTDTSLCLGGMAPKAQLDVRGSALFTGYVGIGTTNPSARLDIKQSALSYNNGIRLFHPSQISYWDIFQNSNMDLNFSYNGIVKAFFDATGSNNVDQNFTGQHRTFIKDIPFSQAGDLEGLIVSSDQNKYIKMSGGIEAGSNAITTNESLPVVSLSTIVNDKKCFGVISASEDPETREEAYGNFVSVSNKEVGDTRVYINSVGEGAMWVVNTAGALESGDYITTSNVAGYGQKQESDSLKNYTVAKITMDCDFNPQDQPIQRIKQSNVVETHYTGMVPVVKGVPHEWVTTTVTADDEWSNVSVSPSDVTYAEWSNLEANVQNTYTLTYTQTSNVVYDVKYTKTTTANVTAEDAWDAVHIEPSTVTYAEYSNLEANVQNTYSLTYTMTTKVEATEAIYSNLSTEDKEFFVPTYYQLVEQTVDAEYPGAVKHETVTDRLENALDEHGQLQWEDDPSGATEKAYKIRYLDASGQITDEANAVHTAAFVGVTYHCG
jgi:hypothetical protein